MDKNAIQKFATWARNELIGQVKQRAFQYGISDKGYGEENASVINGRVLTPDEKRQRQDFVHEIQKNGFEQAVEEVAYTWFNRFVALRFMEVNDYLPTHVRVFSDANGGFNPEILKDVLHLDLEGLDKSKVSELLNGNQTEELYRHLLLTQCNALNEALPEMFEKLGGYTEMLLPHNILKPDGVLGRLVADISEEDWRDAVQIIGWMYQYYNTEPKQAVFDGLKNNVKITKEKIPAATQLFTPDWIVRYMVENSLGRLWLESHPSSGLKVNWKYYLDEVEQTLEVAEKLRVLRAQSPLKSPEDIRLIDPCMGSGHILVYAFDVLMQIYENEGYNPRDAVKSILEKNIYGLDIDYRAYQLAYFSLMMKARQYNRRIFTEDIKPQVYYPEGWSDGEEYGSLQKIVDPGKKPELKANQMTMFDNYERDLRGWNFKRLLSQKYDVVVTNPPYMGLRNMSSKLFDYVMANFSSTKNDLFGVAMEVCEYLSKPVSFVSMITQHTWMFTSGFEEFRKQLIDTHTISTMLHLGTRAFDDISGEVVQSCAFVLSKKILNYSSLFYRLVDYTSSKQKEDAINDEHNKYLCHTDLFSAVPGTPICYWLSEKVFSIFKNNSVVGDWSRTRQGLKTSDDKRFIRFFFEVDGTKIERHLSSIKEAETSTKKWFWLNKGGQVKWYGNNLYVINWENNGQEVKEYATQVAGSYSKNITAIDAYFMSCLSWPQISLSHPAFRFMPKGYIFASAGPSLFVNKPETQWYFLGLLNSVVAQSILDAINPTVNFGVSDILKIPAIFSKEHLDKINTLVISCVEICTCDYNTDETSWDFTRQPLICGERTVAAAFAKWEREAAERFNTLKANEEELNRIFIDVYGLQDELTPEVVDKDVTVRRADLKREIRSLISYAVGCMFGRYSLDTDGLAYAGGKWDVSKYSSIIPDKDNILPICDDEYFEDDIVGRFVDFIRAAYGAETLEENLKFIADALGGKGTPREVIRSYFLNDLFADHCKIYQKRPIYWLFDSGKKNGFKALVYLHRYSRDLLAKMRTDYVHEQQERYRTQLSHIAAALNTSTGAERAKLLKQQDKLAEQLKEITTFEEKVHHLADQNITIDLDDGVKKNYEIFADVLAKI